MPELNNEKKALLHICCGVCASYAIEALSSKGYSVTGYFYNPNIYPYKEYLLREQETKKIAKFYKIKLLNSNCDFTRWEKNCAMFKDEKEGGARCNACFKLRLKETYKKTKNDNFNYFTTTLTISSHKNSQRIFKIGKEIGDNRFLAIDFKKKDGFKKAVEISKKLNLYRQNYCGCIYSLRDREKRVEDKK
ncbi:MAG: epoxyqueuosine reductase QueH [Candidatus Omnitrophica bacterium]|nr:epoxyqueuosine reductase QueH [Candidatus Omnitrophota bacterium]MCF7894987.1 epoxyqueuosine reductase QueH [Candidatus Omnitrophota bacterium]